MAPTQGLLGDASTEEQDCHGTLCCYGWQLQIRLVPGSEVLCCTCPWIEGSLSQHMAFISNHVRPLCRRARSLLKCFICGCQEHEFSNSHNNERMLYIGHTLLKPKMLKSEKRDFMLSKEDLPEF